MPEIKKLLDDKDILVRVKAKEILTDPETAAASAYALGELCDKDAVDSLIKLCEKYGF